MSWTLTSSAACIWLAGSGVNQDIIISGAAMIRFSDDAEGEVVQQTRRDWVTDYAGLTTEMKSTLNKLTAAKVAKSLVSYDRRRYRSLADAQTTMDYLDDIEIKNLNLLKDFKSNTIKSID